VRKGRKQLRPKISQGRTATGIRTEKTTAVWLGPFSPYPVLAITLQCWSLRMQPGSAQWASAGRHPAAVPASQTFTAIFPQSESSFYGQKWQNFSLANLYLAVVTPQDAQVLPSFPIFTSALSQQHV